MSRLEFWAVWRAFNGEFGPGSGTEMTSEGYTGIGWLSEARTFYAEVMCIRQKIEGEKDDKLGIGPLWLDYAITWHWTGS